MIKDLNINVTIITKEKGKLNKTIIDRNIIYHSGTSINYMGVRVFSINLLSDDIAKKLLLDKIDEFNI